LLRTDVHGDEPRLRDRLRGCPSLRARRTTESARQRREICDNDRKYYSIERAKEALGYEPMDNSAHWDGTEYVGPRD
jgi:hypothetical protein